MPKQIIVREGKAPETISVEQADSSSGEISGNSVADQSLIQSAADQTNTGDEVPETDSDVDGETLRDRVSPISAVRNIQQDQRCPFERNNKSIAALINGSCSSGD